MPTKLNFSNSRHLQIHLYTSPGPESLTLCPQTWEWPQVFSQHQGLTLVWHDFWHLHVSPRPCVTCRTLSHSFQCPQHLKPCLRNIYWMNIWMTPSKLIILEIYISMFPDTMDLDKMNYNEIHPIDLFISTIAAPNVTFWAKITWSDWPATHPGEQQWCRSSLLTNGGAWRCSKSRPCI